MNALNTTPVPIEKFTAVEHRFGNTLPLLHEISHALHRLQVEGTVTTLDLNAVPFGPGDERQLVDFLGRGEVSAKLEAMGDSHIRESRYSGVWIVEHWNTSGERVAFQIEITKLPALLEAQQEDIAESLLMLQAALENARNGASV